MKKLILKNNGQPFKRNRPPLITNTLTVGTSTINSPFSFALGNDITITGGYQHQGAVLIAGHKVTSHSSNSIINVGDNNIYNNALNVTVNGIGNNCSGSYHLITGQYNSIASGSFNCSINGNSNAINLGSNFITLNGNANIIGASVSYCQVFGSGNVIPDSLTNVTIIGNNITATQSYSYTVAPAPQQQQQQKT